MEHFHSLEVKQAHTRSWSYKCDIYTWQTIKKPQLPKTTKSARIIEIIDLLIRRVITNDGTPLASCKGISHKLEIPSNLSRTDPDRIFEKKTFQTMKNITLRHALIFLPLRAIGPSTAAKVDISGGTVYRNRVNITPGRYPVIISKMMFLQTHRKCNFVKNSGMLKRLHKYCTYYLYAINWPKNKYII